jgi:predicted secreted protein
MKGDGVCMRKIFLMVFAFIVSVCVVEGAVMEYSDSNVPINVSVGDEFVIKLKTNQTAGYKWQLGETIDQMSIVEFVNTEYKHNPVRVLGGGAEEYWKFKAVGVGTASVELKYVSGYETIAPADRKKFTVNVK